jgi:hypothetical protein
MTADRPRPASIKRKGGGPRSAAGKGIASRNALRHGFSAKLRRPSAAPERIKYLAQAITGDDSDPAVCAAAFKIAENEVLLSEIAAHKVWVVERLREPYANSFTSQDNSWQFELARVMQVWLAEWEINARVPKLLEKYAFRMTAEELKKADPAEMNRLGPQEFKQKFVSEYERLKACGWGSERDFFIPNVPNRLLDLLEEPDASDKSAQSGAATKTISGDRDEFAALEAAIRDLVRLDRHEQRAWSRQKRAILELVNLKLARRFSGACPTVRNCLLDDR